jgi:hypothetical protein
MGIRGFIQNLIADISLVRRKAGLMADKKLIGYARVSTTQQGGSFPEICRRRGPHQSRRERARAIGHSGLRNGKSSAS